MSKSRFVPTVLLTIVDRDDETILKKVLCKDAEDADRVKRLFFRVLNWKLGLKNYGYSIDPIVSHEVEVPKEVTKAVKKIKRVSKAKIESNPQTVEDIQKEIERLQSEKDRMIAEAKETEEKQKKQSELELLKNQIMEDAQRKIEELEKKLA
jgi:hypothetical protein